MWYREREIQFSETVFEGERVLEYKQACLIIAH